MAGQVNMQRVQRQQGRGKILLHFILLFAAVFDGRDQRATVGYRNIKCFHAEAKVRNIFIGYLPVILIKPTRNEIYAATIFTGSLER